MFCQVRFALPASARSVTSNRERTVKSRPRRAGAALADVGQTPLSALAGPDVDVARASRHEFLRNDDRRSTRRPALAGVLMWRSRDFKLL